MWHSRPLRDPPPLHGKCHFKFPFWFSAPLPYWVWVLRLTRWPLYFSLPLFLDHLIGGGDQWANDSLHCIILPSLSSFQKRDGYSNVLATDWSIMAWLNCRHKIDALSRLFGWNHKKPVILLILSKLNVGWLTSLMYQRSGKKIPF